MRFVLISQEKIHENGEFLGSSGMMAQKILQNIFSLQNHEFLVFSGQNFSDFWQKSARFHGIFMLFFGENFLDEMKNLGIYESLGRTFMLRQNTALCTFSLEILRQNQDLKKISLQHFLALKNLMKKPLGA